MVRRALILCVVSAVATIAVASPALAHIDPDPTEAQAGSTLSVAFTVEHGCDGSPTVQLDMRLPDGVTQASPDAVDGWDGSIDTDAATSAAIVTFVGGPLADDEEGTFSVTMTVPSTPDTTIYFPFVQRCEVGEIRWIAIPTDASTPEPEEPAPAMNLIGPVVVTTAAAPSTTTPSTTDVATTDASTTDVVTTDVVTTDAETAASSTIAQTTPTSESPSSTLPVVATDGSQNTGTWFFIASIAAILGLGAFVALRARSARNARDARDVR